MSQRMWIYECTDCGEDRYLRYFEGYWYIMGTLGTGTNCQVCKDLTKSEDDCGNDWCDCRTAEVTVGGLTVGDSIDAAFTPYAASASSSLTDPSVEPLFWYRCWDDDKCKKDDERTLMNGWTESPDIKVQCAPGKEAFKLKVIDWEELKNGNEKSGHAKRPPSCSQRIRSLQETMKAIS